MPVRLDLDSQNSTRQNQIKNNPLFIHDPQIHLISGKVCKKLEFWKLNFPLLYYRGDELGEKAHLFENIFPERRFFFARQCEKVTPA